MIMQIRFIGEDNTIRIDDRPVKNGELFVGHDDDEVLLAFAARSDFQVETAKAETPSHNEE